MKINAKYVCALLAIFSVKNISCDSLPCDFMDSINITDGIKVEFDSILHNNILYKPKYYRKIDYDYENFSTKKFVQEYIRGCPCAVRLCIRMCCPRGTVMHNRKCEPTEEKMEVLLNTTLYNEERKFELVDLAQHKMYGFLYGKPCQHVYELDQPGDKWTLARNGSIIFDDKLYTRNRYCFMQNNLSEPVMPFVCFESEEEFKYALYPIGMLLSVPFLLVTFFVYACIPELRNMHGKSLMCYVLGLAVGYTVLSLVQMAIFEGKSLPCKFLGYMVYFWFMVSFFWLNVMSFDIYWTFRGVRGAKSTERKKFALYSLYAWGCPLLLTSIALTIDNTELLPLNYRPRIGITRCLVAEDKYVEFFYLYLPLLLLVLANVFFFVITAMRIIKIQRETSMVRRGDSKRHSKLDNDRDRFGLYLRLFIVMGVTWSLEVVSWAVNNVAWMFYISDICNCMQGFLIFMLFVWKQKIKRLIYKKFGIPLGEAEMSLSSASTRTTTTTVTSSFNGSKMDRPLVHRVSQDQQLAPQTPIPTVLDTSEKRSKINKFG